MTAARVSFLIAGTQKGGTSALDSYLREHPRICLAARKEVHFFDSETAHASGRPDYAIYHRFFTPRSPDQLLGESTPIYMYWRPAPARIRAYNPAMKLIMSLRNPIARAFSHWNMERSRGAEPLPFWEAITTESARCRGAPGGQHRVFSYVDRGFYARQLERVWGCFPRAQTLILRHDDLAADPRAVLDRVCGFLGLCPLPAVRERRVHATPYATAMTDRERRYLMDVYEPEIGKLERLLGWDCGDWLADPGHGTGAGTERGTG